jgi:predicted GNAT family acetyltransferase
VQVAAYGDDEPAAESAQRLVRLVANGGSVVVARSGGRVVGTGLHAAPIGGFAEIAAVAVAAPWRRRGIAAAVAAQLSRSVLVTGARPFLQAEGEPEARIYSRIGYQRCGFLALAQLPDASP